MATDRGWLDTRRPEPPAELRAALEEVVGTIAADDPHDAVVAELVAQAHSALERALERPGRVRDSAFELLSADALLTWACEVALDGDRPEELLERVIAGGVP